MIQETNYSPQTNINSEESSMSQEMSINSEEISGPEEMNQDETETTTNSAETGNDASHTTVETK